MHAKARNGNSDTVAPASVQREADDRLQERSDRLFNEGGEMMDRGMESEGSTLIKVSEWADRAIAKGFRLYAGELLSQWEAAR